MDSGGLSGRQCVLRTICELKETPLNEWTVIGELIHNVIMYVQLILFLILTFKLVEYFDETMSAQSHGRLLR